MSAALTPSEVYISDDLTLADIQTLEDCEMATLTLARDINRIEEQLADPRVPRETEWEDRAMSAVRFKKAIRNTVQNIASTIRRDERAAAMRTRDRAILDDVAVHYPDEFKYSVARAQADNPELWSK